MCPVVNYGHREKGETVKGWNKVQIVKHLEEAGGSLTVDQFAKIGIGMKELKLFEKQEIVHIFRDGSKTKNWNVVLGKAAKRNT